MSDALPRRVRNLVKSAPGLQSHKFDRRDSKRESKTGPCIIVSLQVNLDCVQVQELEDARVPTTTPYEQDSRVFKFRTFGQTIFKFFRIFFLQVLLLTTSFRTTD